MVNSVSTWLGYGMPRYVSGETELWLCSWGYFGRDEVWISVLNRDPHPQFGWTVSNSRRDKIHKRWEEGKFPLLKLKYPSSAMGHQNCWFLGLDLQGLHHYLAWFFSLQMEDCGTSHPLLACELIPTSLSYINTYCLFFWWTLANAHLLPSTP